MENASKALIIAGGMLLAMLIVGLLVFARGELSSYQEAEDEAKRQEQLTEFNQKFESYNKKVVTGFQMISLCNMIEDYNQSVKDTGYNKITLTAKWHRFKQDYSNTLVPLTLDDIDSNKTNKEFKQKYFTCKDIKYDKSTGRVLEMIYDEITKKE